jgi:hypothetical protein
VLLTSLTTATGFTAVACSPIPLQVEIGVCCALAMFVNLLHCLLFFGSLQANSAAASKEGCACQKHACRSSVG